MSLTEKPHTVVIELPETEETPSGYESAPGATGEVTIQCQITPKTAGYGVQNYGIDLTRPYKLMAETSDEPFLIHGARVRWNVNGRQRIFEIRTPVRYHGQGDDCDHVSVLLEEDFGGAN